jgi:hypothetical protein
MPSVVDPLTGPTINVPDVDAERQHVGARLRLYDAAIDELVGPEASSLEDLDPHVLSYLADNPWARLEIQQHDAAGDHWIPLRLSRPLRGAEW